MGLESQAKELHSRYRWRFGELERFCRGLCKLSPLYDGLNWLSMSLVGVVVGGIRRVFSFSPFSPLGCAVCGFFVSAAVVFARGL